MEPETAVVEEGWLVALPEDLVDELDSKIEACYEQLLQAVIDPKLMQRLLDAVSPRELGEFVDAIAAAVESPDERPFCRR